MTNSQKKTIKWYQDHSKKFDNYLSMKEVDGIVIIKTETEDYSIGIRGGVYFTKNLIKGVQKPLLKTN